LAARSWAGCTTNMFGFDLRQAQVVFNKVKRLWLAALKRRSQTARLSWERFIQFVARFFPPIRTIHPLPCHRCDARTQGRSPVR
jgi:RNA-directed DNA polymerase